MRVLAAATLFIAILAPARAAAANSLLAPSALSATSTLARPLAVDLSLLDEVGALLGDAQLQSEGAGRRNGGVSVAEPDGAPVGSGSVNLAAAGSSSTPQGRTFGVGLQLGLPTSIILKYMLQQNQGLAAGLGGFSGFVLNSGSITLFVDYLYHPHLLTAGEAFSLTWYIGGGGQIIINDRFATPYIRGVLYPGFYYGSYFWLAARVPIGVSLALAQAPIDVFVEAVPSLLVFPALTFGVGGSIGVRFWF